MHKRLQLLLQIVKWHLSILHFHKHIFMASFSTVITLQKI